MQGVFYHLAEPGKHLLLKFRDVAPLIQNLFAAIPVAAGRAACASSAIPAAAGRTVSSRREI